MRVRSIRHIGQRDAEESRTLILPSSSPKTALTEAEAASYIGMSAAWLKKSRTKRFRGVIDAPPFIRAGAKRVVYRIEDLDEWQDKHLERVGPTEIDQAGQAGQTCEVTVLSDGASDGA